MHLLSETMNDLAKSSRSTNIREGFEKLGNNQEGNRKHKRTCTEAREISAEQ